MPSIQFLTAVVSIGFLISVALSMSYFAYLGYRDQTDDDGRTSGNRSSLAD